MAPLQLGDETAPTAVVHCWGTQLSQKLCAAQQVTQAEALLVLRVVCGLLSWYGLCMNVKSCHRTMAGGALDAVLKTLVVPVAQALLLLSELAATRPAGKPGPSEVDRGCLLRSGLMLPCWC